MGETAMDDVPQSETLGFEHSRRLRRLYEDLAGDFANALSDLLRCSLSVTLDDIDALSCGEWIAGLATPSYFSLLDAAPFGDRWMLDIEPSILYPMIDRLLGGGQENEPPPSRPLTDIEQPLAARIVRLFLRRFCAAWQNAFNLESPAEFEVLQVESRPAELRILPSDERVVIVGFRLEVGESQGMMRMCVPSRAVRRIGAGRRPTTADNAEKMFASGGDSSSFQAEAAGDAERNLSSADGSLAEVRVTLATTPIAVAELDRLQVGDIIVTETDAGSPAVVSIDGRPSHLAMPGVCQGRKAVRLVDSADGVSPAS